MRVVRRHQIGHFPIQVRHRRKLLAPRRQFLHNADRYHHTTHQDNRAQHDVGDVQPIRGWIAHEILLSGAIVHGSSHAQTKRLRSGFSNGNAGFQDSFVLKSGSLTQPTNYRCVAGEISRDDAVAGHCTERRVTPAPRALSKLPLNSPSVAASRELACWPPMDSDDRLVSALTTTVVVPEIVPVRTCAYKCSAAAGEMRA